MPPFTELLIGGVLPGVLALVLLALPWILKPARAPRISEWVAPVAFAVAFVPASIIANKHASFWPVNASERALAVAGVALASALTTLLVVRLLISPARMRQRRRGGLVPPVVTSVLAFAAGAFAAFAVLKPLHPHSISSPLLVGMVTLSGGWVASASLLLGWSWRHRPGVRVPGLLSFALLGASLVMLFSAIGVFAQSMGGLVAAMSSAALVGLWKRSYALHATACVVPLSLLAYFLLGAWQLSPNPATGSIVLVGISPFIVAATALVSKSRRTIVAAMWIAFAIYTLATVGWAYSIYSGSQSASDYGY